jgi:hypothetical protein
LRAVDLTATKQIKMALRNAATTYDTKLNHFYSRKKQGANAQMRRTRTCEEISARHKRIVMA